jgi:hypothetical protein
MASLRSENSIVATDYKLLGSASDVAAIDNCPVQLDECIAVPAYRSADSCAKLNIFLPRIAASSTTKRAKRPFSNVYKTSVARPVAQDQAEKGNLISRSRH